MKSKKEIITKLTELIEEQSLGRIPASTVASTDRIIEDLGLDSLDFATIMLSCEEWLAIKIDENKVRWSDVRTVDSLADLFVIIPEK